MIQISLNSKSYSCDFYIRHKFNIIKGDSGRGKTNFVDILRSDSAGYKLDISDKRFDVEVLEDSIFKTVIANGNHRTNCIYIIDDQNLASTEDFAKLYNNDKSNIFILFEREVERVGYPMISYSVDSIYIMKCNGRYHTNENLIKQYDVTNKLINQCIVEDIGSGFSFFKKIFDHCSTTEGKDKVFYWILDHKNELKENYNYLVIDWCGAGSCIEDILLLINKLKLNISLNSAYQSFEYMLLRSNMFHLLREELTNNIMVQNPNLEDYYENIIKEITKDKVYEYSKSASKFRRCYTEKCCTMNRKNKLCDKGISGDKIIGLLRDTEFEYLLEYYNSMKEDI